MIFRPDDRSKSHDDHLKIPNLPPKKKKEPPIPAPRKNVDKELAKVNAKIKTCNLSDESNGNANNESPVLRKKSESMLSKIDDEQVRFDTQNWSNGQISKDIIFNMKSCLGL